MTMVPASPTEGWSPEAALRGAETMHQRGTLAHRREVFQAALQELAPTHPALYHDTVTIMRALAVALARVLDMEER